MPLGDYESKRRFDRTPEPKPGKTVETGGSRFYIQRHSARRLHYDLRLEAEGVLKSWAVPKGPTLDPKIKRMAVHVEDHPLDYGNFHGTIPQGNYGAGTVSVWDHGRYELLGDLPFADQLKRGDLKFRLHGQKLAGEFALVTSKKDRKEWLLIKKQDFAVIEGWDPESDLRPVTQAASNVESVVGAVKSAIPKTYSPMLATLSKKLPEGPEWVYEPKWDGVRAICVIKDGKVSLISRSGRHMDHQYPELAELARVLNVESAVLDGEIVALDDRGRPSFELLQSRMGAGAFESRKHSQSLPVLLFAFDLLYLNGFDLRSVSLLERKALLKQIIPSSTLVRYSEHFAGKGEELLHAARENELEGVVAKRGSSRYESKRSTDWMKVKVIDQQEFVICGMLLGEREPFGSLVLGCKSGADFVYVGNVGSGFTDQSLKSVYSLLKDQTTTKSPFTETPKIPGKVVWVKPTVVCTVRYVQFTQAGRLRAPVFVGLRDEVAVDECTLPNASTEPEAAPEPVLELIDNKKAEQILAIAGRSLKFTNLNKVFYPREGYTKRDVLNYYHSVAEHIVPHLQGRPLSLKRFPDGIEGEYFFQKNAPKGVPEWVRSELIQSNHNEEPTRMLLAEDEPSLLYLANLGCIDQNPWMSRMGSLDCPDFMLIDLDPVACTFDKIVEAANLVKRMLDKLELQGFPKTTGGDGLHIYVPLAPEYDFTQVRSFTEIIARLAATDRPDLFTTPRAVEKREKGKVYFDYLQIAEGKTISAPYVLRAHPGAPVATPLRWTELTPDLTPDRFTIATVKDRFARLGDIFKPVLTLKQKLEPALGRIELLVNPRK